MYSYKVEDAPERCFLDSRGAKPFPELVDRLALASHGVPLPDMSYPSELPEGTMPLLPENERFIEPADLYQREEMAKRKFESVNRKIDSELKFRKQYE